MKSPREINRALEGLTAGGRLDSLGVVSRRLAADLLGVSLDTIDRMGADGRLEKFNLGHGPAITLASVRKLNNNNP